MPESNQIPSRLRCLPEPLKPLANKFYSAHRAKMKASHDDHVWVLEHPHIIAAVCLRPVDDGYWLTSLFVAPEHRLQGHAKTLVNAAGTHYKQTIWLFCHPLLSSLYQALGFRFCDQLPEALADRLQRYQRSKSLVAMSAAPR